MHTFQYTLSRQDVYQHFAQLLLGHLRLHRYGRRCSADCLIRILAAAAAQRGSVHGLCKQMYAPSDETVRKAIKANLPDAAELEQRINRALAADVPAALKEKRQQLALDLVLIPYHGEAKHNPDEVVRGQPKCGTTHFHAYATVAVMRKGRRFTLALMWVRQGDAMSRVVQRLMRLASALGVHPKRLLLDRGFFTVSVVRYLQAAHLPFLIAMPIRGRKAKAGKPAGGTRALCEGKHSRFTRYSWCDPHGHKATVAVAVIYCPKRARQQRQPPPRARARRPRADVPFELYAYGAWQPKSLESVRVIYRKRFGIESGYRQLNQARIRTSTQDPLVRLLYVGLALILRNLWVWLHYAVLSGPHQGGRIFHWEWLRLRTLLAWLQQLTEKFFRVRSLIVTERSPPPALRPAG